MNKFDENLRNMAKAEQREIPECVKQSIDDALENLPAKPKKNNILRIVSRTLATAACVAIVFLFVLPNVSPAYANTMEKVPIINRIVKVLTIKNYIHSEARHELDVKVPSIDENHEAADYINKDVDELTQILVGQFYKDIELNGHNGYGSIHMDYAVVTDTEQWFTLKLSVTETAASSNHYFKYYHIDKMNGKIIALSDLFRDESYINILTEEIKKQMQNQMQENPDIKYWMQETEFSEAFSSVRPDHNFYWNSDGKLVIAFDKYEVGPGSMGTPEFLIPTEIIQSILKPEYQNL